MAGKMMAVKSVACMAILCMLVAAPSAEAALTCGTVISKLAPCVSYVKGAGAAPPPGACCAAIKALSAAATTTADRQAACNCLKSAAKAYTGGQLSRISSVPGKCNVNIGYALSTSTNCASIK
ncbi:unnamed protein product [Cuscuta epithymum]|uniref:Non-specific lipid-transfer protein n=1 Tax=Cuscuta epithymum TaxID=186058 RepID=A0AAV0DHT8_9ASTE|nr:unnamed protein product [Cuscuta epithymum]